MPSRRRKSLRRSRCGTVVGAWGLPARVTPVTLGAAEAVARSPPSRAAPADAVAHLRGDPGGGTTGLPGRRLWGTLVQMPPVPGTPDPESGPPARPATGRRRASAVPPLSVGRLDDVCPGALLVAMPSLTDPTFAGTVVYVLDHTDTGTLGVVLGRPSQVEIRDVLPGWCDLAVEPERVPRRRPVRVRHRPVPGHGAVRPSPMPTVRCGACPATSTWSTSTPTRPTSPTQLTGLRVFAGYAGLVARSAGRRDRRGRLGVRARARRTTCCSEVSGPELWRAVMGRQTGALAVLSTAPADPTAN